MLGRGWQGQLSINTVEPSPISEANRDGRLVLDSGAVRTDRAVGVLQFQIPAQSFARGPHGVSPSEFCQFEPFDVILLVVLGDLHGHNSSDTSTTCQSFGQLRPAMPSRDNWAHRAEDTMTRRRGHLGTGPPDLHGEGGRGTSEGWAASPHSFSYLE